jgi:colicin import membrane protein
MSDAKAAEKLWLEAHEHVKNGNLAQGVRDLAKCYEMLKALKDPRLPQVHRRWVEVHKLYQARKQQQQAQQQQAAAQQAEQQAAAQAQAAAEAQAQAAAQARQQAAANEAIQVEARAQADAAMSLEEHAETAANAGDLDKAVALYERIVTEQPTNELARERLAELRAASGRAAEMSGGARPSPAEAAAVAPGQAAPAAAPVDDVAFLEGLLSRVQERRRSV